MSWGKRRVGMMAFIAACLIFSAIASFREPTRDGLKFRNHASPTMITWCSYNLILVIMLWEQRLSLTLRLKLS